MNKDYLSEAKHHALLAWCCGNSRATRTPEETELDARLGLAHALLEGDDETIARRLERWQHKLARIRGA